MFDNCPFTRQSCIVGDVGASVFGVPPTPETLSACAAAGLTNTNHLYGSEIHKPNKNIIFSSLFLFPPRFLLLSPLSVVLSFCFCYHFSFQVDLWTFLNFIFSLLICPLAPSVFILLSLFKLSSSQVSSLKVPLFVRFILGSLFS